MSATGESLPKQTQTSMRRRSFRRGILVLLLFALAGLLTFRADQAAMEWIDAHFSKAIKNVAGHISDYGDWPWLMLAGAVGAGLAWWRKQRGVLRLILLMMLASSVAGLAANTLRLTTGRTRPSAKKVEPGWYGLRHDGKWIIGKNKFNSFPSGHTATAFGFFGLVLFRHRRTGWLLLVPAVMMALSRMAIDAHHFSDVYYGAWFGMAAAWAVSRWDRGKMARLPG